jgi:PAS domain S-box-containing protein
MQTNSTATVATLPNGDKVEPVSPDSALCAEASKLQALGGNERDFRRMIDALPAAIYTTDAKGRITHFNPACVEFSGRTPELGSDHWCVTWKLYYPDGRPMPHDACPMAIALKERRIVRGAEAIAERPDGSRIWFEPYPTPLFDESGNLVGGINMLVDITARKQAEEATARLAEIVKSSDDAIISKDLDGIIRSWNRGAQHLYGYSANEIVGKPVTTLIPDDHLDDEPAILARLRRGERIDHYETVRRRKDGSLVDISLTVSPVRDSTGRIIGAAKIARDITERKRTEEALRDSEERFRMLADNMAQLAWTCDKLGNVTWYNRRWLEYTGHSFEEMRDWGWTKCHHPDHVDRVVASVTHSRETGEIWEDTFPLRGKDGKYRWFLSRAIPIRDTKGNIIRWFGTNTDVTEQLAAEESLREADRRKNEFLAMLAHELRNPLAPIRNAVQILQLAGGDETIQSVSDTMERQVNQLVRMVDDLLDVNRISKGKIELRTSRVELAAVVHHAVEAVRPNCENRGHDLSITLPEQPVYLDADLARLAQVIANLLNNACKFTNNGGRISLTAEPQGDQVVIRVTDNGIGIAPDQLPRIFDMFTQVDTSLERSVSGLGIGLTLVKNLVEMHGGTVEARSNGLGQGSEFVVRLPLGVAVPEASRPAPTDGKPAAIVSRRILVVDDNRDSAKTMAVLLKLSGHEAHTAFDGLEAVAAAEALRPHVILLDIGLPKLNGYETAITIRDQPWGKDMLLIAVTGWGQDDDRQKAKDAGFDAHLVKPVDHAALTKLLAETQIGAP